jgi:hypothetical protein
MGIFDRIFLLKKLATEKKNAGTGLMSPSEWKWTDRRKLRSGSDPGIDIPKLQVPKLEGTLGTSPDFERASSLVGGWCCNTFPH